ncbi:MAG TPA: GAF domain-containing protein [Gammaproteobacteria bacterium]|nr:GAF domain-containing protein [Gammaproteobacteria bacterium]
MNMRFWSSLAVTVLVVAGCVYVSWVPQSTMPFDGRAVPGHPLQVSIMPSSTGIPLPPELQAGDVIDGSSMTLHARMAFVGAVGNPVAGQTIDLPILRGGKALTVRVAFQLDHKSGENLVVYMAFLALAWLFAALGLLLLWRGQRQAAWAVCLWCLLNVLADVGTSVYVPTPLSNILATLSTYFLAIGTLMALYLLADDLTRAGTTQRTRRLMCYLFMMAFGVYAIGNPASTYLIIFHATYAAQVRFLILAHLAAFSVPLILLALFYRKAPAEERARIRWVWASILVYVAAYVVGVSGNLLPLDNLQLGLIINLLTAVAFLGFTYAVLRHRLVSLRLVLNRALVYGVITSLVVGVFAALSSLIEHFAVGKTEGALLQLLVPLSLGVTLNLIKKRLDGFVERLFFQRQYRAETALTRLIRESAFIEDRDTLLDRTVGETLEFLRPTGVALYERSESGYTLVRQQGERKFPKSLAKDDAAMVSLRASLTEADLDGLSSALGREGLAFPLAVRGTLTGALVLGQRPAEHYTQSERALLARIGQQVAAALHALRAREAETFVDAVARGELAAPPKTKSRARQLLQQNLAA